MSSGARAQPTAGPPVADRRAHYDAGREAIAAQDREPIGGADERIDAPTLEEYPPTFGMSELDAETVLAALKGYGCLRIDRLFSSDVVDELVDGIDRVFEAFDDRNDSSDVEGSVQDAVWYDPFIPQPDPVHATRPWLRERGGVFTGDSPVMMARWFSLLESSGILRLVQGCIGREPITSLDKCALRRVRSKVGTGIEWHQDGSFLGVENGAMNLWLCLTDTATAPGLEIVARRFTDIVETGSGGANYSWSTGDTVVERLAEETPVVRPRFRPGDALLFDGLLLHRTAQPPPEVPDERYAIETWFFRPDYFPSHQTTPLAFHPVRREA